MTRDEYNDLKLGLQTATNRADFALACLQKQLAKFEAANQPQVVCPYCGKEMVQTIRNTWWYCLLSGGGCGLVGPDNDLDGSKVMSLAKQRKLPIKPPFVVVDGNAYPVLAIREATYKDRWLGDQIKVCPTRYRASFGDRPILGDPTDISEFLQ